MYNIIYTYLSILFWNFSNNPSKLAYKLIQYFPYQSCLSLFFWNFQPLYNSNYDLQLRDMNSVEQQVSITEDNYEILAAESESDSCSFPPEHFGNGTIRVGEENWEHGIIKNCFVMGMGELAKDTEVVAIHRNSFSGLSGQAKLESFRIFSEAVAKKSGGNANIKFAWYGGSKKDISDIISHGFAHSDTSPNGELYGHGICLSPAKFSVNSVISSDVDENGLRHILLCRVILGKPEQVCAGSDQSHPSSEEFDTGVDNLTEPKRYIVWNSYMNSYILPSFIISVKSPSLIGLQRNPGPSLAPRSAYMSFPKLMSILKSYLGNSEMVFITKCHNAFLEKKITRSQFITKVRHIAGDDLLKAVIKLSKNKV